MRTTSFRFSCLFLVFVTLLSAAACQRAADTPPATAAAPAAPPPPYMPAATIKDLMQSIVDVAADTVWLSVTTTASEKGLIETKPQNDEEWNKVRHGAIQLAEAANLLMMPGRHVARPGEKSETPGVELEPEEMEKSINNSRGVWEDRAKALHEAAMLAVKAAEEKNAEKIFEVGENIEMACENCHRQYWYPNEKIPELPTP
jgi:hypothetical protein